MYNAYFVMVLGRGSNLCSFFCYNIPKTQLRLPSSTWAAAASRWLHARPTQQPSVALANERAPMTYSASGGHEKAPSRDCSLAPRGGEESVMNGNPSTAQG